MEVTVRRVPRGDVAYRASSDHLISVHAGSPTRVSCAGSAATSLTTRGEIFILPSGASDLCTQDDPSDVIDLRIPKALVWRAAEELGLEPGLELPLECGVRDPRLEHIAWALASEERAGELADRLYRESLGLALAVQLLMRHRAPRTSSRVRGLPPEQLSPVLDCIEADLAGDLSLARLARVAGASPSHFRVLFKRSMGVPVHEYVIQRRVARAQELLRRGHPKSAIAFEAGFAHQSHMARSMRRVLGVAPSELTRSAEEKGPDRVEG